MTLKSIQKVVFIFLGAWLCFSCNTVHKVSIGRAFRNVTAYYNTYFNAKEIYNQDLKKIELANPDHYDRLLAFYKLGDEASATGLTNDMDLVIKKLSDLITRHERSDWIDDAYLLMGKAYYLKGDYIAALDNFGYLYNTFSNDSLREAALIWSARASLKLKKNKDAESSLDLALSGNPKSIKKNNDELYSTAALFALQNQDSLSCLNYLDKAIAGSHSKTNKIRYHFIIAQLQNFRNQPEKALEQYQAILKLNPTYEIAFSAHLAIANNQGIQDPHGERSLLENYLRDDKNLEFKDQIYYTLGNLSLREGKVKEAIKLYNLSLQNSLSDINQRGLNYEQLAFIYLNKEINYRLGKTYFDSTVTSLDKDYPNYAALVLEKQKLSELVRNYEIISQGDTLITYAKLSPNDQKSRVHALILAEIEKQKEEELRTVQAYQKQLLLASAQFAGSQVNPNQTTSQNSFFNTSSGPGLGGFGTQSSYNPSSSHQGQYYAQGAGTNTVSGGFGGNSGLSQGSGAFNTSGFNGSGGQNFGNNSYGNSSSNGLGSGGSGFGGGSGFSNSNSGNTGQGFNSSGSSSPFSSLGTSPTVPVTNNGIPGNYQGNASNTSGFGNIPGNGNNTNFGNNTGLPGNTTLPGNLPNNNTYNTPGTGLGNPDPNSTGTSGFNNAGGLNSGTNNSYPGAPNYPSGNNFGNTQNQVPGNGFGGNAQTGTGQGNNGFSSYYGGGGSSTFYFNNPIAMSSGYGQFLQKWGNRTLKDNWRVGSRNGIGLEDPGSDSVQASRNSLVVLEKAGLNPRKAEERYLALIPKTEAKQDSIQKKMVEAYLNNAEIYDLDLKDYPNALESYNQALGLKTDTSLRVQIYFDIYAIYNKLSDPGYYKLTGTEGAGNPENKKISPEIALQKAGEWKQKIIREYPHSNFSTYFLHPESLYVDKKPDSVLEKYYDSTYVHFLHHDFKTVLKDVGSIPVGKRGNYLAVKFDYLRALSVGYTHPVEDFKKELVHMGTQYPKDSLGIESLRLLSEIEKHPGMYEFRITALEFPRHENGIELAEQREAERENYLRLKKEEEEKARKSFFKPDFEGPYQFLIVLKKSKLNLNTLRLNLSLFEQYNFQPLHLKNVMGTIPGDVPAMYVSSFPTIKSAIAYYQKFEEQKEDLVGLAASQFDYYFASRTQMEKITDTASQNIYREFFNDQILPYTSTVAPKPLPQAGAELKPKDNSIPKAPARIQTDFPLVKTGKFLVAAYIKNTRTSLNSVRLKISLYNQANYGEKNLSQNSQFVEKEFQSIVVGYFPSLETARAYYQNLVKNKEEIFPVSPGEVDLMVISPENYQKIKTRDLESDYLSFFEKNLKNP